MVPKCPIQNVLGDFLNRFDLGHFDEPKFHEFEALLTSLDSQRVALHILQHPTQGEWYTITYFTVNSSSNTDVLDMPVTAVIFVINKCIANFQNVLICLTLHDKSVQKQSK